MEKAKRLKLYSEKDYTETIDFPVELVGRDGVVRRYSYADSIRIYERRIESAHIRYHDREIINAEIYHCSRRLEQIQRSWRVRISSSERQYVEGRPGLKDRELYERGKQFLRAYIDQLLSGIDSSAELGAPNLVNLEERDDFQIFYINWPIFHPGTLLYVYRLSGSNGIDLHQEYLRYIEVLRVGEAAPDTEKLVHHEAQQEMAFVLTSPRHEPLLKSRDGARAMMLKGASSQAQVHAEDLALLEGALDQVGVPEDGPYRNGLDDLRRNDFDSAFNHFREALEENPFYKEAYWALAALTDALGRWEECEPYLLMALKYFPDEPRAHFYHGLVLFRSSRLKEAQEAFTRAIQLNIGQSRAYGFLACAQALRGQFRNAAGTLERGLRLFPRERSLTRLAAPLQRSLRWQGRFVALSVIVVVSTLSLAIIAADPVVWVAAITGGLLLFGLYLRQLREARQQLLEWVKPA